MSIRTRVTRAAAAVCTGLLVTVPALTAHEGPATAVAKAELSIVPGRGALTVTFVARSSGFASPVSKYEWVFGDGARTTTPRASVSHTYKKPGRFQVSLTEIGAGKRATAVGALLLYRCPAGVATCSESLRSVGRVQLLRAAGEVSAGTAGELDLFVAPFQIPSCQIEVVPTGAVDDGGFKGDVTITLHYTSTHPGQTGTTCFSATAPFVDRAGKKVENGALRSCRATNSSPPCVHSVKATSSEVDKVLLVPAGDPKVGAP